MNTRLVLILFPLLLVAGCRVPAATGSVEFWVAPDGNDAGPGTRRKPFATVEGARDRIRGQRAETQTSRRAVTVWIKGGAYPRTGTFELTAADGGAAGAPVVYRAVPGETPVFLGGRAVTFGPLRDDPALGRLPEQARAHVVVADLVAQGITNYGSLVSRGFSRATRPAHLELFHGGRPMTLARWPNEGEWAKITGFPEASAQPDDHGGKIGDLKAGFSYDGDRPKSWQHRDDIWVHGYWAWDWANSYERVESFDDGRRTLRTAAPHGLYGFRKGQRFYFLNVLEELDQPGEWYLDRKTGRLYFWPPAGTTGARATVSILESPLIRLKEVEHVVVRGLVLEACRGTAVEVVGGTSNRVEACWIRNTGNSGITIAGGRGHVVAACDVEDNGDGGVNVEGGDRQTLTPGGHRVENCRFQRQGRWSKCYVPAILMGGVGLTASHNLIQDHPHCAILFTGNEHLIEFNEIHHVALETGDVGAIYTGRDWTFRGNRIRHNYIHDTGGVGMGSMGVYMDDCVSGTVIEGNLFENVQRAAFLGGGRDHRVENNIFINCKPAVALDGRGMDKSPVWHGMVYDFMKKQLEKMPQALYRSRYPALDDLNKYYEGDPGMPPEGNVVRRNISVGGQWLEVGWHAKKEMLDLGDNLVDTDARFRNAAAHDFRPAPDSPALKLGFQPIPTDQIGLKKDGLRSELEQHRQALGLATARRGK